MTPDMKNYAYGSELVKSIVNDYRVISFKEKTKDGTPWIAQCLEYDITSQGDTAGQAITNLLKSIEDESLIEGGIARLSKAPQMFHDLWDSEEVIVG